MSAENLVGAGDDAVVEGVLADYRSEMIVAMNRYHGCDRYGREQSCRADVYRVDHVILPIARKMLEQLR